MATQRKSKSTTKVNDGLVNVVANLGTARDKAASSTYIHEFLSAFDLSTAYRNSWLARAIVDYPAEDSTRKWRQWRAKAEQITAIEQLEKKLNVKSIVKKAVTNARLFGGAAIYLNTTGKAQDKPLIPGREELKSLVVLTRNSLTAEAVVKDINNPYYGKPEFYTLSTDEKANRVRIHASRLAVFVGNDLPDDSTIASDGNSWGDSVLQSTIDVIRQSDSTMANMASLVFEAKVDVFKFKGFAEMIADARNDAMVTRRLVTQAAMKGINGAVVIDGEDDYQQKIASLSGLPDVVAKFSEAVAGASRIPVTRLYGRASVGLSGSGDGDERVYFDRINDLQADIGSAIDVLDECLIHQALNGRPTEIYYEWKPLRQMTEMERAEIFTKTASAARSLAGTSAGEIIPIDALSDAVVNEFVEQGMLPGLEQAIAKYGSMNEQNDLGGDDEVS